MTTGHTAAELAALIDHAVLRPDATEAELRSACEAASRWRPASVCVRPCDVPLAAELLAAAGVPVAAVISFPHGSAATDAKAGEARRAVADGAQELDMVVNIARLRDGRTDAVRDDIAAVMEAAGGRAVKVILECCYLDREQKVAGCRAAEAAGAAFVKTSTGFGSHGATPEDVRLLRESVSPSLGVKAAGGIRSLADCRAMLAAGATRLGTSHTFEILAEV